MVQHLKIASNSQHESTSRTQEFSGIFLKIGEGNLPENDLVKLTKTVGKIVFTVEEFVRSVNEYVVQILHDQNSRACERAILKPKNDQAAINNSILSSIEGN